MAGPKQSGNIFHQKYFRAETADEVKVTQNQLIAWITDTRAIDAMHGKPLARGTTEDDIASVSTGEMRFS
ncbi:MAG: hypothetical protein A2286_14290 [Gammaproteobacteria bacterium RIFOXYA12_FULL_61_12]|nr:MAG: hypothetical protein A2286_14290 [Gammaproteobacteria bacterium RIFOXYA12_FULL_61_12]OGT89631.1 MAG: hypothetical protein A2514_14630 [Gammaproteobacteria bacterium RIFOXYD12_FULL_61_37]